MWETACTRTSRTSGTLVWHRPGFGWQLTEGQLNQMQKKVGKKRPEQGWATGVLLFKLGISDEWRREIFLSCLCFVHTSCKICVRKTQICHSFIKRFIISNWSEHVKAGYVVTLCRKFPQCKYSLFLQGLTHVWDTIYSPSLPWGLNECLFYSVTHIHTPACRQTHCAWSVPQGKRGMWWGNLCPLISSSDNYTWRSFVPRLGKTLDKSEQKLAWWVFMEAAGASSSLTSIIFSQLPEASGQEYDK